MGYLVGVIIERSAQALDKPFFYYSDKFLINNVRVLVSFNNAPLIGYVEEVTELMDRNQYEKEHGFKLNEVLEIIDDKPLLNEELFQLVHYLSNHYCTPLIQCYKVVLPPSLKPSSGKKTPIKYQKYVSLNSFDCKLTDKQLELVNRLKVCDLPLKECSNSITSLRNKNIVTIYDKEVYRSPYYKDYPHIEDYPLTNEQKIVLDEFKNSDDNIYLLHGETGSGKTEIYINLIKEYLAKGKNILFLVPEISLTPLMVKRIKERIDEPIAVFHSLLTNGEKYDEYRRIKENKVRVVIGARSAIFSPLQNIGLIIMDEEHSTTYKQDDMAPKYDTLDLAIYRCKYHNAKLILGSATPNLVTMTKAKKGLFHYLSLPHRINNCLCKTYIVDMKKEEAKHNFSFVSSLLKEKIIDRLNKKEQVILLLNQRGYAPYLTCEDCKKTVTCPECGIPLHYHRDKKLKCHYCGREFDFIKHCPNCGSHNLKLRGFGTQKVEEYLTNTFNCNVKRLDLDSSKGYQHILDDFENKKIDILVGTQIISKGLDFDNVTLVGVINADIGLNSPSYRASETVFSLLYQMIGRSGRGDKSGEAVIQTLNPDHYAIVHAANNDYNGFFNEEYQIRKLKNYPPFRYISSLMFLADKQDKADYYAFKTKEYLMSLNIDRLEVLGPTQPYVEYFNHKYRSVLTLKYFNEDEIIKVLNVVRDRMQDNVSMYVDLNPLKGE